MGYIRRIKMKTKIIYNDKLLNKLGILMRIDGITIYPFVVVREDYLDEYGDILLNHELIHIEQQKELYLLGFYILYITYYLYNLIKYCNHNKAYMNIPFEQEAYDNQLNLEYINNRRQHNWSTYV